MKTNTKNKINQPELQQQNNKNANIHNLTTSVKQQKLHISQTIFGTDFSPDLF